MRSYLQGLLGRLVPQEPPSVAFKQSEDGDSRELRALAALRVLFTCASYRYASDVNNLAVGWQMTFGEPMPARPTLTVKDTIDRGVSWDVYIDGTAENFVALLSRVRIVQHKPGRQFELRAMDAASLYRVAGPRMQAFAEAWLRQLGITVHDTSGPFADK